MQRFETGIDKQNCGKELKSLQQEKYKPQDKRAEAYRKINDIQKEINNIALTSQCYQKVIDALNKFNEFFNLLKSNETFLKKHHEQHDILLETMLKPHSIVSVYYESFIIEDNSAVIENYLMHMLNQLSKMLQSFCCQVDIGQLTIKKIEAIIGKINDKKILVKWQNKEHLVNDPKKNPALIQDREELYNDLKKIYDLTKSFNEKNVYSRLSLGYFLKTIVLTGSCINLVYYANESFEHLSTTASVFKQGKFYSGCTSSVFAVALAITIILQIKFDLMEPEINSMTFKKL